jgi:hypothetical protein
VAPDASLEALDAALTEAFDPDEFGFPWYESIEDVEVRGVRSNQLIGLRDAAAAHLQALQFAAEELRNLVGPNGRTMPAKTNPQEVRDHERIKIEITDCLRAAGSLLDVLGGLSVLFLGMPVDPARATGAHLIDLEPAPSDPYADQAAAIEAAREAVNEEAAQPTGWLDWTLESRNALVHRAASMTVWLPVPSGLPKHWLAVVTGSEPHRVVRQFPHMRRLPDLSDAETVLIGKKYDELWLAEPAQETLQALAERCEALTARVAKLFLDELDNLEQFRWPEASWRLPDRRPRAIRADAFTGFRERSGFPEVSEIRMSPRDANRLMTMENLRKRREGKDS